MAKNLGEGFDEAGKNINKLNEELGYVEDTVVSIADALSKSVKNAISDIRDESKGIAEIYSKNITKSLREVARNSDSILKNQIKLYQGTLKTKDLEKQILDNEVKKFAIQRNQENLKKAGIKLSSAQRREFALAKREIENQNQLLEAQNEELKEIEGNTGVKTFSGIEDIAKSIPGLRKFSGPFEKAAKAAKDQALSNKLAHGSVKGMGKAISPMKAGFKALGGTIMKAIGPLAIAKVLIDIGKFFLDAMFEASKQTSQISRDLGVSKNFAGETLTTIKQMGLAMKGPYINAAAFLETQGKINEALGLSLNLATGYGDKVAENAFKVAQLNKKIGLDAQQSQRLLSDNLETEGDITEEITGRLTLLMLEEGFHSGTKDILKETLSITGTLRANFKGNAVALAEAVYQAKVLGFNLKDLEGIQSNLLSFQTSIEAEMEAELLTGRQLNLEKARTLALDNDLVGVAEELNKQNITYSEFSNMNVFARQATAKALGMEVNQMADILQKQEDLNKLKGLAKQTEFESLKIVDENGKIQAKGRQAILDMLRKEGHKRDIIIDQLGEEGAQRLLNQDAQEKFNDALDKAKGIFTQFVTGGALDDLASGLEKITDSFLFKTLIGDPKGDRKRRETASQLQKNVGKLGIKDKGLLTSIEEFKEGEMSQATLQAELNQFYKKKYETGFDLGTTIVSPSEMKRMSAKGLRIDDIYSTLSSNNISPEPLEDFIIRPGQKPLKYRKDDIIIGGTNLDGGKGSEKTHQLLERLIMAVEQGQNISVDGNRLNTAVAMNTSKFGA